ncbi:MAG TPA: hypothetical protein VIX73_21555 [Kofleriaceae bacterium]|jgi:hypothetical protein
MEVLTAIAAAALLAGCYEPALRDCTVSCQAPGDCASGQVCGADRMCAAPEIAGHCARIAPDAGASPDARLEPAPDARPDASPTVRLTVMVMGKGSVVIDGTTTCSSLDPQRGNCAYDVAPGIAITAQAMAIQLDQTFTRWTSETCGGEPARCTFTPDAATVISARFDKLADHGAL